MELQLLLMAGETLTEAGGLEFKPDWTIAPASMLRLYLEENNLSLRVALAGSMPLYRRDEAVAMLEQVLAKQPLTGEHARLLHGATGIPAQFWLTFEHNYRAGLAAGLIDATGESGG